MRRRDVIALVGSATAWPLSVRAQQADRMRRIGVLINYADSDPIMTPRLAVFRKALHELGWIEGRNVRIDLRWGVDADEMRKSASELAALSPDVVLANAPASVFAWQRANRTVPVVFVAVTDPVGLGIAQSLARPRGNATGFLATEFGMSAKWLELLKEIAPGLQRVAVLQEPSNPGSAPQFAAIQAVAPTFGVEVSSIGMHSEIERAVADFARMGNGGLIVTRISETITQHDLIVTLATRHRLPAIYPLRLFVTGGGLASYGPDIVDQYRRTASYVDRILKGEKPADLPVQAPTKYELVINLKTAKALDIDVPTTLLARADEVIE